MKSSFREFASVADRNWMTLRIPDAADPFSLAEAAQTERWLLDNRDQMCGAYLMLAVAWDFAVLPNLQTHTDYDFDEVLRFLAFDDTYARVRAVWERRVLRATVDLWDLEDEDRVGCRAWRSASAALSRTEPAIEELDWLHHQYWVE